MVLALLLTTMPSDAYARSNIQRMNCEERLLKITNAGDAREWCTYLAPKSANRNVDILTVSEAMDWYHNVQDDNLRNTRTAIKYIENGFSIADAIVLANENPHWFSSNILNTLKNFFQSKHFIYISALLFLTLVIFIIYRLLRRISHLEDAYQSVIEELAIHDPHYSRKKGSSS
jgi:hypothetical protein